MRLYDRRKLSEFIDKKTGEKAESRDAIIWDIYASDGYCRVKVQGSNELVVAHLPTNWSWIPPWCKKGNAVCIRHKKGIRGYVEVIGDARARPTAVAGGSITFPEMPPSGIVSGMVVTVESAISLAISSGTYRWGGTLYGFAGATDAPAMEDDAVVMGDGIIILGGVQDALYINVMPDYGYVSYALIYVTGDTGIAGITLGSSVKTTSLGCLGPVIPLTPPGTLKLAHILLIGNSNDMVNSDIDRMWTDPYYSYFTWSWGQGRIADDDDNPLVDAIILSCWSQYYLPLYGEVTFAVGVSYGDLWAPDDRSIELSGSPVVGTPEYHPVQGFCVAQWSTISIKDDPMKWLFLPFDYFEIIPPLGPPQYNTIIAISIQRKAGEEIDGIPTDPGTKINYTENMYWLADPTFEFGGDLDLIGNLW